MTAVSEDRNDSPRNIDEYIAAFKRHISFFPAPSGVEQFKDELAGYKTSKGTIQFPFGQPVPYDLIRRIVLFRVQENLAK